MIDYICIHSLGLYMLFKMQFKVLDDKKPYSTLMTKIKKDLKMLGLQGKRVKI